MPAIETLTSSKTHAPESHPEFDAVVLNTSARIFLLIFICLLTPKVVFDCTNPLDPSISGIPRIFPTSQVATPDTAILPADPPSPYDQSQPVFRPSAVLHVWVELI